MQIVAKELATPLDTSTPSTAVNTAAANSDVTGIKIRAYTGSIPDNLSASKDKRDIA